MRGEGRSLWWENGELKDDDVSLSRNANRMIWNCLKCICWCLLICLRTGPLSVSTNAALANIGCFSFTRLWLLGRTLLLLFLLSTWNLYDNNCIICMIINTNDWKNISLEILEMQQNYSFWKSIYSCSQFTSCCFCCCIVV